MSKVRIILFYLPEERAHKICALSIDRSTKDSTISIAFNIFNQMSCFVESFKDWA